MAYQLATAKIWNGTAWIDAVGGLQPVTSGGDYEGEVDGYYYNVFTQPGSLVVSRDLNCEVLLVGGGGGGGGIIGNSNTSGGGGAGGVVLTNTTVTAGTKSISIGSGGNHGATENDRGTNGGNTTFNGLTAYGGGGGGACNSNRTGLVGASGGGGGEEGQNNAGGYPLGHLTTHTDSVDGRGEQGHAGGSSSNGNNKGGGGGGAGGPAVDAGNNWKIDNESLPADIFYGLEGQGGSGIRLDSWGAACAALGMSGIGFESVSWTGISATITGYWIASGGSGGNDGGSARIVAPYGGGANGASNSLAAAGSRANSGGGGGGGANNFDSSDGASGICIVRYRV